MKKKITKKTDKTKVVKASRELDAILKRALIVQEALAKAKALYKEQDELTLKILSFGQKSWERHGHYFVLVDNFADSNTTFRVARIKRFDLKIEPLARYLDDTKVFRVRRRK